ncbi:MAG: orotate phosphoribosyltransferase [Bacteroidales bacterium]|nr:orotate phosphoribosyltransferase [Bacteroidales bacterium]
MIYNKESALIISEYLLQIKAVMLNTANPFTWTSGLRSPIYCDNRKTLSFPKIRTFIRQEFVDIINEEFGSIDVIAGVATGAIAQGALVAHELGLPFVYVRAEERKHGTGNKIEGYIESGQSVIVIEDLISTGKSSFSAVRVLAEAGCKVKGLLAIFTYNLQVAEDNNTDPDLRVFTLTDYEALIEKAVLSNYINESEQESLLDWKKDPQKWSDKFDKT